MSITITLKGAGYQVPYFTCDVCGEPITSASTANLLWSADKLKLDGDTTVALIAHKNRCTLAADKHFGTHHHSTDLSVAIYQLMTNAGMSRLDLERARKTNEMLLEVGRAL